jgi:hypothetical protein
MSIPSSIPSSIIVSINRMARLDTRARRRRARKLMRRSRGWVGEIKFYPSLWANHNCLTEEIVLREFMDFLLGVCEERYRAPLHNSLPPRFAAVSRCK